MPMPRRFVARHQPPTRLGTWLKAGAGALLALAVISGLGEWSGTQLLVAPLGASAMLVFGLPDSPLSQPANVIGGHLIATALALVLDRLLPGSGWSVALAVALVIGVLGALRITHPPAGADPVVVMMLHPGWGYLVAPVLAGTLALVAVAVLVHRLPPRRPYPLPV
jgi:CBS-domain-containing membrane protein